MKHMTQFNNCIALVCLFATLGLASCAKKEPRAGDSHTGAVSQENQGGDTAASMPTHMMAISIQSSAFMQGADIPEMYTCDGKNVSPHLSWGEGPSGTRAWALIMDDPDAPSKTWVHWVLWNLPDSTRTLSSGLPSGDLPGGGRQGKNDFGKQSYGGPCPPVGKPHRYFFRLYALDTPLKLAAGATRDDVDRAMEGHILGRGELMGMYARPK